MLNLLRRSRESRRVVQALETALVERARAPVFFAVLAVPDTLDGRFDLVALHAWLVLAELKEKRETSLSQRLTDCVFVGFDEALRELGTGDMGMGRKLKSMANAFYGRLAAYEAAKAAGGEDAMADALLRNVYRGKEGCGPQARVLAFYVGSARRALAGSDLASGVADFGPLPA